MASDDKNLLNDALDHYNEVLAQYKHRELWNHIKGPAVSAVVHVILIILAFLFIKQISKTDDSQEIEVTIEEMEIKEVEPKILEELEELEQLAEEVVPTVAKPEVSAEVTEEVVSAEDFEPDMASTDDAMDFSDVLDIKPSTTALKIPSMFQGRSDQARKQQLSRHGGSAETERAVMKALRWLKKHQNSDGSWADSQKDAMTGLGLLAFLAHGETPSSEEFGVTVQKALQYLSNRMMKSRNGMSNPYVNGIVTYSLCEAYALTRLPFLKGAMEKGLDAIIEGQQELGGWDYGYRKDERWDLSVAGWQMQALKAGYVGGATNEGLGEAMEKSLHFLKNVAFSEGRFGYSNSRRNGSWGMQGAGVLCLQLLGEGKSNEARAGVSNIMENRAGSIAWPPEGHGLYNWYYETQAMFHGGRTPWQKWNRRFSQIMVKNQEDDGHWDTSKDGKGKGYTPYFDTTLGCLSLQVYYRYLPTYKMPKPVAQKTESSIFDLSDENLGIDID